MYTAFASVYDRLMAATDYDAWAGFYTKLLEWAGVPSGGLVAECACGTGSLTVPLARRYRMTGLDLSQDMLSIAARKARAAGLDIPLVCQDMRKMSLHRLQDAVLCTCDGVNYLMTPTQLARFFKRAFAALKPGGALVFDLSSTHKLSKTLGNNTLVHVDEDVSYIWRNRWSEAGRCLNMDLSVFARRPDGAFDRVEESQTQRAHGAEEIASALSGAGFVDVRAFGDQRMSPPGPREPRLHFVAIRPPES